MAELVLEPRQRAETDTIADLVEKYLERHQPANYRLVVTRSAIRQGTRRWLVQIGTLSAAGVEIQVAIWPIASLPRMTIWTGTFPGSFG